MGKPTTEAERAELIEVVARAIEGDQQAWANLVKRYESLITSIVRRYRLPAEDAVDVGQTVWLKLVQHLPRLRSPLALPGWISITASRVCLGIIADGRRTVLMDPMVLAEPDARHHVVNNAKQHVDLDDTLVKLENARALRDGLAELTDPQRDLLTLLVAEPPLSYAQISARLGVPIGSIGPNRARYLKRLCRTTAVRRLIRAEEASGYAPAAA